MTLPRMIFADLCRRSFKKSACLKDVQDSVGCLSGKYADLLDMISFVVVCFYMLTIGGIFILRKKKPDIERPYKAFGYPVLPILYIIMGACFCLLLIIHKPKFTWPGLLITLLGIPVYYIVIYSKSKMIIPK